VLSVFIMFIGDIEVHKGRDGRFYVVDTARIFPPLTPDRSHRACHLINLMRPGTFLCTHRHLNLRLCK
jgi:hypothetical protein